ncbi:hypothetical protein, partial [Escherichia coli]|uniref:hypothetical protein n=1 Tax=Escherichia coli TaxID=562 RepID=UPI00195A1F2F
SFVMKKVDARVVGTHHHHLGGWIPTKTNCQGSIAECRMEGGEEFDLDSEINRRGCSNSFVKPETEEPTKIHWKQTSMATFYSWVFILLCATL